MNPADAGQGWSWMKWGSLWASSGSVAGGGPGWRARLADALLVGGASLVLFGGLVLRLLDLGHVPGVSGDEAFYGIQAYRFLHGQPYQTRTPTGLPLNPLFWSLEVPLLLVFRPAIWILRAPAVLCGTLAVVGVFVLMSRTLDRWTGVVAAVVLAALPTAIGYARFGWDQSQAPLLVVIALFCALRGDLVRLVAAVGLCLVVHLANVFVLPVVLLPFWVVIWRDRARPAVRRWAEVLGTATAALVVVWFAARANPQPRALDPARLASLTGIQAFFEYLEQFFTGESLYAWLSGPVDPAAFGWRGTVLRWLSGLVLVVGTYRLVRARSWERLAVVGGLLASIACLYVGGGPEVLHPLTTRYGIFLLVPAAVSAGILLGAAVPAPGPARRVLLAAVLAACGFGLVDFHRHFFEAIRARGGIGIQPAFRTAAVEPKQQALAVILEGVQRGGDTRPPRPVLAEDWWTATPLQFLALDRSEIKVELAVGLQILSCELLQRRLRGGGYAVGFAGGPLDLLVQTCTSNPLAPALTRWVIPAYTGDPLLVVYRFP